jgi:hypothetical protein
VVHIIDEVLLPADELTKLNAKVAAAGARWRRAGGAFVNRLRRQRRCGYM